MMNRDKYRVLKQQLVIKQALLYQNSVSVDGYELNNTIVSRLIKSLAESIAKDFVIPTAILLNVNTPKMIARLNNMFLDLADRITLRNNREVPVTQRGISDLIYKFPNVGDFFQEVSKSDGLFDDLPVQKGMEELDARINIGLGNIIAFAELEQPEDSRLTISEIMLLLNCIQLTEEYYHRENIIGLK